MELLPAHIIFSSKSIVSSSLRKVLPKLFCTLTTPCLFSLAPDKSNQIPVLVPLQAFLTCVGNTSAAYAAFRIARSNGWQSPELPVLSDWISGSTKAPDTETVVQHQQPESASLIGFEDLGDALAGDNDYTFLIKLFAGCAVASYVIKYGETFWSFPYDANVYLGLSVVAIPSALNAFKWYKRSQDPSFEGWF